MIAFGETNVTDFKGPTADCDYAVLFPGTSAEVIFCWNNYRDPKAQLTTRSVKISNASASKPPIKSVKKWLTSRSVFPGMTVKELQKIAGDMVFNWDVVGNESFVGTTTFGADDNTEYYVWLEPGFKFNAAQGVNGSYTIAEAAEENAIVYAVEFLKAYQPDNITDNSEEDSLDEDLSNEENMDSSRAEHVIPFKAFFKKYIATRAIGRVKLPYDLGPDREGIETIDSPDGAFHHNEHDNGSVRLLGLLPDTTKFYGIIYQMHPLWYIVTGPASFYETFICTFSKSGQLIDVAKVRLESDTNDPSSCSREVKTTGTIAPDLSFNCTESIRLTKCDGENKEQFEEAKISGRINPDGSITSMVEERKRVE